MSFFRAGLATISIALVIIVLALTPKPTVIGDGMEYILASESFLRHLSPDLQEQDVESVKSLDGSAGLNIGFFVELSRGSYYKAKGGNLYGYHFWFYPLISTPALWLVEKMRWTTTLAFSITNAVVLIIGALYVAFAGKRSNIESLVVISGLLLCGSSYYLSWNHPEVETFVFTLLASVCLINREFRRGALFAALASLQNPPIAFLAAAALALDAIDVIINRKSKFRFLVLAFVVSALILLPPMFYFWNFGKANLIEANGYTSTSLINVSRFVSFFLDLDQGMLVGAPFLLVGLGAMVCAFSVPLARKRLFRDGSPLSLPVVVLLVAPMVLAIPALTARNWNSGDYVFMRYAFWACAPWIVCLTVFVGRMKPDGAWAIACVFIAGQASYVLAMGITGESHNALARTAASRFALTHFPSLYNPEPNTFLQRGGIPAPHDDRSYFFVSSGEATKILINGVKLRNPDSLIQRLCGSIPKRMSTIKKDSGWVYINLSGCKVVQPDGVHEFDPGGGGR